MLLYKYSFNILYKAKTRTFYFYDANSLVEKVELSDGEYITNTDINLIIQSMTAYATANDIQLTNINDVKSNQDLMNIVANSWNPAA